MGKAIQRAGILCAGVLSLGVFGIAGWVYRVGRRRAALDPHAEAIVVLGAKVFPGGIPSGALRARAEEGARLYAAGAAAWLILSGGADAQAEGRSEAEVAAGLARACGVPEAALLVEPDSHNTRENAAYTARLLRARGLTTVILVSDPFHLLRARQCFRQEGFEPLLCAAPLEGRGLSAAELCYWTFREAFALLLRPWLLCQRVASATR